MTKTSFNGINITWGQVAYLQSILSNQEFITFLGNSSRVPNKKSVIRDMRWRNSPKVV
jgi:hypothetical protein